MLTYEMASAKPGGFRSITGMSVEEFKALLAQVQPRYEAIVKAQIERADRRRAPGGGVKSRYDVRERLLMTMVWLRLYVTCDAVGIFFGVNKGTVSRMTRPILLILQALGRDTLGWPTEARDLVHPIDDKPNSADDPVDDEASLADEPVDDETSSGDQSADDDLGPADEHQNPPSDVWAEANEWPQGVERQTVGTPDQSNCPDDSAIVDATEQRVERSSVDETQKRFYSGKRKAHTVKTQIVVNERGRIRHVSDSVPGSTHDLTLLRQSGLKTELPEGIPLIGDCGYQGMQKDFPNHSVALPYRPNPGQKLTPEEKDHNHIISCIRVVVEHTIAEMKHFQALVAKFRHSIERHKQVVDAIVGIVNRHIDKRLAKLATQGLANA